MAWQSLCLANWQLLLCPPHACWFSLLVVLCLSFSLRCFLTPCLSPFCLFPSRAPSVFFFFFFLDVCLASCHTLSGLSVPFLLPSEISFLTVIIVIIIIFIIIIFSSSSLSFSLQQRLLRLFRTRERPAQTP